MSLPLSIASYFTIWWIVLFSVLPFGVRSHMEAGVTDAPQGSELGAPVAPMIARKAIWTTVIAAVVFAALDAYVYLAG